MDLEKRQEQYRAEQEIRAINSALGFTDRLRRLKLIEAIPGKPDHVVLLLDREIRHTERAIVSCFEKLA